MPSGSPLVATPGCCYSGSPFLPKYTGHTHDCRRHRQTTRSRSRLYLARRADRAFNREIVVMGGLVVNFCDSTTGVGAKTILSRGIRIAASGEGLDIEVGAVGRTLHLIERAVIAGKQGASHAVRRHTRSACAGKDIAGQRCRRRRFRHPPGMERRYNEQECFRMLKALMPTSADTIYAPALRLALKPPRQMIVSFRVFSC